MRAAGCFALAVGALGALAQPVRPFIDKYCAGCHSGAKPAGEVSLAGLDPGRPAAHAPTWERVAARLRAGSMPPPGAPRPPAAEYRTIASALEAAIDTAPDRVPAAPPPPVHRLNRVEYGNAVRDLFGLEVDVRDRLPGDETADGSFDNLAGSLSISPAHLEQYMTVARMVTRLAVGLPPARPDTVVHRMPLHVLQDDRMGEDLPLGSRGGMAIRHYFPASGEYAVRVRLQRQYQDYIKGMGWPQLLDVRLDGKLVKRFTVGGGAKGRAASASYAGDGEPGYAGDPDWERYMQVEGDAGLEVRFRAEAGPRVVAVAFVREMWEPEGLPQPLQRGRVIANDQVYMSHANVGDVRITGPLGPAAVANMQLDTPSRRAIFVCRPTTAADERACASRILARLARLAYRGPVREADLATLLQFFDEGRAGRGFDEAIQYALERMLCDPLFLLRTRVGSADLALASRLSFFLWSSIPDARLLNAAGRGTLREPAVLRAEVDRMLADPRSARALTDGFAAQWLNLRRVEEVVADPTLFPNYDESLLRAFRRETEMFVEHAIAANRPLRELLDADYTFANQRLARHYGITGVHGSRFRRVALPDPSRRGGLLAHGSVLAVTSYPDRTSPVLRGKWLLNNMLGASVPAPPPGLDTTLESKPGKPAPIRERLAAHRKNPACNSCHTAIDPLGFALENFDAIGAWRDRDESGAAADSTGVTAAGVEVRGLAGLRAELLSDPDQFPRTVIAKLLSYALGRALDDRDQPTVRAIAKLAAEQGYRWRAVLAAVVMSPAFVADATGPAPREVSFRASDGGVVYALDYGKGRRGVVLVHGGRFNKESWHTQARRLVDAGFRVVSIDMRGYGKSRGPGDSDLFTAPLHLDALAAVRYMRASGTPRVSLMGGSIGGSAAGGAAAEAKPGEVERLILLAALPEVAAEKVRVPKLIIVARDDTSGDGPRLPGIRKWFDAAPEPRELVIVDGEAHAQFLFQSDQNERVMREILRYLGPGK